jgi:hypothetical protein
VCVSTRIARTLAAKSAARNSTAALLKSFGHAASWRAAVVGSAKERHPGLVAVRWIWQCAHACQLLRVHSASSITNNTKGLGFPPTFRSRVIGKARQGSLHKRRQCAQVRIEKVRKKQSTIVRLPYPARNAAMQEPSKVSDMQFDGDKFRRWLQRHHSATRSQWKVLWDGNRRRADKAVEPDKKSKRNQG